MDKIYNPQSIEPARYKDWDSKGLFAPDAGKTGYCIMLPPPNVTGRLHMGHAFQQTLMDALIRYHRMNGDSTLWQCGTDHAGIATQMVVERQLESQHKSRRDLGREQFIEAVWKWKQRSGNAISRQSRRLGASMDWSRERFTMDQGLSNAVKQVFIKLHDEGLIYRGKRLVNWDPVLRTAVSDPRWYRSKSAAICGIFAIHWPNRAIPWSGTVILWSRPPALKPCWATPRSRCTLMINAIRP